jgi:N-acetylmuramoyl-L-alanine amidase
MNMSRSRTGPRTTAAAAVLAAVTLVGACAVASGGSGDGVAAGPGVTVPPGARVVLIDPGHNGGNSLDPKAINREVPDGRGGTKACNTAGTARADGFTEHEFTWKVSLRLKQFLEEHGVRAVLTRNDDVGVGPCVDVRGKMAEEVGADAAVSIHADGGPPSGHGFHVSYAAPPLSPSQGEPSVSLATTLRDGMRGAGLSPSTYLGKNGLFPRSDLAGLNLSRRPTALVECENMRNADESEMLKSEVGQERIAHAIGTALLTWLKAHPPASSG